MPDETKKSPNAFQKVASWAKDVVEWVEATFSDPAIASTVRDDLGLNPDNPATPAHPSDATKRKIDEFVAKQDVDEAALAQTAAQIKELVDAVLTFADAVKTDSVDEWDVFWLLFRVWLLDSFRLRNPSAYALCQLAGFVTEDEDTIGQLDPAALARLLRGEADQADGEALVQRPSTLAGTLVVVLDQAVDAIGGSIDALYGWDPDPGTDPESAVIAARVLTVVLSIPALAPVKPAITLIGVPSGHGGPGVVVSFTAGLELAQTLGTTTYTFSAASAGAFTLYLGKGGVRALAGIHPTIAVRAEPAEGQAGRPALVVGTTDATRFEIGSLAYGIEVGSDHAAFRVAARKGKLVVRLGDGDGFLRSLPGGNVEVPFDLGLVADTTKGVRFEGGTGLRVNLPVAASLFGVFTIQFVELSLDLTGAAALELVGGFSLHLGPFQASIDRTGLRVDLAAVARGVDDLGALVAFSPPKGIGLVLDAGVVKGGGYLFVDAARGEYGGALELTFLSFSIKALGLLTTKRPDGSEGWSLLVFVFGQFNIHIAFGIFWTGLGGMVGLHHRADLDALTAGMRTGALDDVLFPANPVADAPRILARYRTLFPIEGDTLLLGPMMELSFSQPPIVYVRLGLVFEVRNALGGDRPATLTKVILLGQLLAQLPPKATGVPAIVKLLVDVVGFYDAPEQFLMIRARLRDSFVGIEGFATINLSGELLLAMRFGSQPSFVLSAGGFHPAFKDLPAGVPGNLDRLAVSFKVGPISMRSEQYFAITSNSVQGGFKIEIGADFGVASIKGWLAFDALVYLSPRFHFLVSLTFAVSVRAAGTNLCSVRVDLALEGPGEWHAKGTFSFSILFWDVEVGFDERWGSAPAVDAGVTSAAAALLAELGDPARLEPEGPVGGASIVSLAPPEGAALRLAHPLGLLTVRQRAVPFEVQIDRLGTKRLTEGTPTFSVTEVKVGGQPTQAKAPVLDHFARGQFMELTEAERLGGRSFERFPCGVTVGTDTFALPAAHADVKVVYERKLLEPTPPTIVGGRWSAVRLAASALSFGVAADAAHLGSAARSARASKDALTAAGVGAAVVQPPALALVAPGTLTEAASLLGAAERSPAIAAQTAATAQARVVEAFEVQR